MSFNGKLWVAYMIFLLAAVFSGSGVLGYVLFGAAIGIGASGVINAFHEMRKSDG